MVPSSFLQSRDSNALFGIDELRHEVVHLSLCDELRELVQVVRHGLRCHAKATEESHVTLASQRRY